jgi:2-keto-4-pentenoate hydratase/2-oxohepta-3-ene-1,7-dioic acid hydratase in catechol pathway
MNFSLPGSPEIRGGIQIESLCLDLTAASLAGRLELQPFGLLEDLIRSPEGLRGIERLLSGLKLESLTEFVVPLDRLRFRPPVLHPEKIIGIGLNYRDHAAEVGATRERQEPLLFAMFANAVIGHEDPIAIPDRTDQIDYEAELGVVIGRQARGVSVDEAVDYVAGYTIVNDVSARDLQHSDGQWLRAKSFDTFAPMGPCIATTSDLDDGDGLKIELRLNGHSMQKSNTGNMIFKVPQLVSHISQAITLQPGDIIATGTPAGVGYKRNPPVFLKPGDVVEIELEGVGTLRNTVAKTD